MSGFEAIEDQYDRLIASVERTKMSDVLQDWLADPGCRIYAVTDRKTDSLAVVFCGTRDEVFDAMRRFDVYRAGLE